MPTNLQAAEYDTVGQKRWMWPVFALPGVVWLVLLFLIPFYAIFAVAMGQVDPILGRAMPEWNPFYWDPTVFAEVLESLFGGALGETALRTIAYVFVACLLCLMIGYPVAYFVSRKAGRWRWFWLLAILAPFWINYLMRMMSWVNLLSPNGQVNELLAMFGYTSLPDWLAGHHFVVILGLVAVWGGFTARGDFRITYAQSVSDMSIVERGKLWMLDALRGYNAVVVATICGVLLIGLSILTFNLFGS